MQRWLVALLLVLAAVGGFMLGLLLDTETIADAHIKALSRIKIVAEAPVTLQAQSTTAPAKVSCPELDGSKYRVLSKAVWPKTPWGKICSKDKLSSGQETLCQLPSVWKDCSQGIYLDIGTNVGVQIRKLYDAWQFPKASVLGLFNKTFGKKRRGVCSIGVEANTVHTNYLLDLNKYFQRKDYQALVLTETAASVKAGTATFHLDHDSPVEWGASLSTGSWQHNGNNNKASTKAVVDLIDLPAFMKDIVRPLVRQIELETGKRPPVGMKMDVEGEEYALLPGLILSGGLCDLDMMYIETHWEGMRNANGVEMSIQAIEEVFRKFRKANPHCKINYTHLDDETFLHGDTVPLPK